MNKKTTYEQLITKKLEDMPVPDMADAIWARIERQLDIDMPTDDGDPGPDPNNPSGGGWMIGSGLFVFVVALVTIFLVNKNKNKTENSIPAPQRTIQRNDNVSKNNVFNGNSNRATDFKNRRMNNQQPVAVPGITPINEVPVASGHTGNQDTTAVVPQFTAPPQLKPDTLQQVTTVVPPPVRQDTIKPKRSRGVKGITDNDYRIVPVNKDSTNP